MVWVIAGAVAVGLFALTWWSSGRARPEGRPRAVSQTEKDYLAQSPSSRVGDWGGFSGPGS